MSTIGRRALTSSEKTQLYEAEQLLVRECMWDKGFRVWLVPQNPVTEAREFPYGVDDAAWAAKHGYGTDIQQRVERVRTTDPNRRYFDSLTPKRRKAALAALNGPSPDGLEQKLPNGSTVRRSDKGCTARAESELYGDLTAWFRAKVITDQFNGMAQARVFADPAYEKAVKNWSSCMRKHGYDYTSPDQSRARFLATDSTSAQKPTDKQIRSALAEAECARSSGLSATAHRLERHYEALLRAQHRTAVRTRLRLEHAALSKAWEITR